MKLTKKLFGFINEQPVTLFTIKNNKGFEVSCMDYGCIITEILAPDRFGKIENTVLGFGSLEEYEGNSYFLGAVVGRFAGRIKRGSFNLEGNVYQVKTNENNNHLHGGHKGFSHVLWDSKVIKCEHKTAVEFSYFSPDGEEGYPGNLKMKVVYTIYNGSNDLVITYSGISDKKTLINVTNHTYFNLSGNLERDILDHELTIDSQQFIELNEELLPTGNLVPVDHSVFDFRQGRKISDGVESNHPQNILVGNGYDHPFLLNKSETHAIVLVDHESGRKLVLETTEPSVVLYTGNNLEGSYSTEGVELQNYLGVCLETQSPPDSIHHQHFQSSIVREGEVFKSKTKYSFGLI
ncbi:galactose mutarotase [Psychrobacillus glaciei]|uniref:Aldose 1-epimerase n=1 Tax=Psychrobacillus glaciei TaxID=2283160 RepID=A0A5J6SIH7_9BACI|nr:aldose epimerase family protein [Psychrobacillus glaciei]QFF97608.1 galactose mutarotase [Psychrobacillus glaciei]